MATFLITGGAGYVGASLAGLLTKRGDRVRRMFRAGKTPPPLMDGALVEDVEGDVTQRSDLRHALEDVDTVLHLAAQTSFYAAESDPVSDLEVNVKGTLLLLECCRELGSRPTVVFASTASVYGIAPRLPVGAETPAEPLTIYDRHKLAAEGYLQHYVALGRVRGASLRLANVYGPGPRSSRPDRGVLNGMVRRALAGETLKIYGSGAFLRDYIFVEDVARAFLSTAAAPDAVNGRQFALGSGSGHTLSDAVRLVARLVSAKTGKEVRVEHVEPPAGLSPIENRNFVADPTPLWETVGFRAEVSLAEGIQRTIDYFATAENRT